MKTLATAGVAALLLATTGYAALAGTIAGTIKGPDGAPFRAAFVRVQNLSNKITMMVLTDSQGRYFADNLPTGNYTVTPTSVGFKASPLRRNNVAVEDGKRVALDFTMQNGMVEWSELAKFQAGTLLPQAHGNGKEVLVQLCFNCHAFGKIGAVGRHDLQGWKDEIDVMRQTGVARIGPNVRDEVAAYLAAAFGPGSATPKSPAGLPGYQAVKRGRNSFSDEALNIVYVDYELTGGPKDRPGRLVPTRMAICGWRWRAVCRGSIPKPASSRRGGSPNSTTPSSTRSCRPTDRCGSRWKGKAGSPGSTRARRGSRSSSTRR